MHVWQAPALKSAVGKRVIIAGVEGPRSLTGRLVDQLLQQAPSDAGRQIQLATVDQLPQPPEIQLTSATDAVPSDVALMPIARSEGFDYVLQGRVIEKTHQRIRRDVVPIQNAAPEHITLSWRLLATSGDQPPIGAPLTVHFDDAMQRYPDLANEEDPTLALLKAAARDTNRLILPSLRKDEVLLARPYLTPLSGRVRKGNKLAKNGNWQMAAQLWGEALRWNPLNTSAMVNLSLAAVARQDFTQAKELARRAVRWAPTKFNKENLVWIELRQREYHKSFGLDDPPEGWFVTFDEAP
ncbi:tetratricopeptide repeat protein [Crateriforma conspicua]|uniref:Tetratricopeptide repeat protein n=1 Tax=Crateriforma conspicua TaxID=2527996 RepID=A0A5C5Y3W0_9PLAN|nr:hypothetical protein [Crateriforma conspicua]TWT69844.1 Tetratricopeptide repeat protein [Crateriforma conspicua]